MFKLSKLADYSTVIMADLVACGEGAQTAKQVAQRTRLPEPTVRKILKLLTKKGLLVSTRGVRGGYTLAMRADEIGLLDILSAIETDPVALTECAGAHDHCDVAAHCHVAPQWQSITRIVETALSGLSLADLLPPQTIMRDC